MRGGSCNLAALAPVAHESRRRSMQLLLERALPIIAAWGVWVLAALLAAALFTFWRLGKGRPFLIPARWPGRVGSVGSIGVAALSGLGLCVLLGALHPMLEQVRSIEGAVGRPARDVDLRLVSDRTPRRLSELRGQVVLINVWAT